MCDKSAEEHVAKTEGKKSTKKAEPGPRISDTAGTQDESYEADKERVELKAKHQVDRSQVTGEPPAKKKALDSLQSEQSVLTVLSEFVVGTSTDRSGTYAVIDVSFFTRGEKAHFAHDSTELILCDKKKQLIKLIAYNNQAIELRDTKPGTVYEITSYTLKDDSYVQSLGCHIPVHLVADNRTTFVENEELSKQLKTYINHLTRKTMIASNIESFNGFILTARHTKTLFPHRVKIRNEDGYMSTVVFETADIPAKTIQLALFNEAIIHTPSLLVGEDYRIQHTHLKQHREGMRHFADMDLVANTNVCFVPVKNRVVDQAQISLLEMKNTENLPPLAEVEVVLATQPTQTYSANGFYTYFAQVCDGSEEDQKLLTAGLNIVTMDKNPSWHIGSSVKGTFEVSIQERMITLTGFESHFDVGTLSIPKLAYKIKQFLYK